MIDEYDARAETLETDILIVGSGMGGSTLAWALRHGAERVLVAERGTYLPREPENSDPTEVYLHARYKNADAWYDADTRAPFQPGVYYWVGGNTRVYGACLPRFRASDFVDTRQREGMSRGWPFTYEDLEEHYCTAEQLYQVHGGIGEDPTEPPRSQPFPFPPLAHEPVIQRLSRSLRRQGLHPFHMPNGMNLTSMQDRAACTTCDGAPCQSGNKSDAENRALSAAIAEGNVQLATGIRIDRLETSPDGRSITAAVGERAGSPVRIVARKYVLSAGAVNSAVILLRSANARHPQGVANSTGLVGRNYMVHNSTFFMAFNPFRRNKTLWQKTLGINDWYEAGAATPYPLGNVQMLGKLQAPMVKAAKRWVPLWLLRFITDRSVDFYLTTEDLADEDNGVRLVDERIHITWRRNNDEAHRELVRKMRRAARRAGLPIVLTQRMGIETNSHQCGTAVAGDDAATSVLDRDCRAHDVDNLWLVDSSFFPSSAALNPALTIAANAIRVAPAIANA